MSRRSWCRSCGDTVYWFPKTDGGMFRPLVSFGPVFIPDSEGKISGMSTTAYQLHRCDPVKVKDFETEAKAERLRKEEYENTLRELQIVALKHECPKCGAKINEACVNLNSRKKNEIKKTRWPHEERMPHASSNEEQT